MFSPVIRAGVPETNSLFGWRNQPQGHGQEYQGYRRGHAPRNPVEEKRGEQEGEAQEVATDDFNPLYHKVWFELIKQK